ncbi:ferrous iron transport protein B [Nitratidesulfovibrio sp. SRB-5]|uniref:ferrous iron transport protein B n=1 Tax=Nitratidesulfovibrio sp. SRB-5 TaxID=2872636 RepID=UPI001026883C|nr:ferrous iron transport protein B [Nitratidesulfovibrio sp. SRB-5]MBZ2173493.1 ferrous iron transport protein B [Nitratidesulfovibrio sp. SRB-5]RXF75862.1 ferrous iron transport protein B [Desulfovibrio sp. DS-1]
MSANVIVALAGNPNSGKTTAFNEYTGSRQHVGNYPGITVEKKEGIARVDGREVRVVDLPGTYSLTAYTQEEVVARRVLVEDRPDVVIDVINAGALERNLYLAVQLMELGIPVALGLNMIDEARKQGLRIDAARLSQLLDLPVVETVARTGEGLKALMSAAVAHGDAKRGAPWKPLEISYGPDLDPVLARMVERIEAARFLTDKYPARWVALKYLESDDDIRALGRAAGPLAAELEAMAAEVARHLEATLNSYPEAVIADYRYGYISGVLRQGVLTRHDELSQRLAASDRMDRVLTHRLLGPVIMLAVLYGIYEITFAIGEYPMGWVEAFFGWLNETASAALPDGLLKSLVVSGIIDGVGGVMGFVPLIMLMFMMIAFLEDSGYMARVAYMLDRVFRLFGLHGCSVMPYIVSGGIAGGCAVPGVMAARTLRSPRERLATILTAPFMTCGAKLPVFILFVGVFFAEQQAQAMFALTLLGWGMALIVARILRSTVIKGESTPFVMELPPYRLPTLRGILIHTWERTWQYIKKAGTVILAISILLWAAMTFPQLPEDRTAAFETQRAAVTAQKEAAEAAAEKGDAAEATAATAAEEGAEAAAEGEKTDPFEEQLAAIDAEEAAAGLEHSIAGRVGIALESVTGAAGFDWRTNIALVGGFAAKEVIVSTLGTAYSLGEVDAEDAGSLAERIKADPHWTPAAAAALMVFVLLYAPCFVTVVAIKQESGSWRWAIFSTVFSTIMAFGLAVAVYQIGTAMLGGG